MFRRAARIALILVPAFALAACGSAREEELERQLAEAKATALEEAAARKQAERNASAARAQAADQSLSDFYGSDGEGEMVTPDVPADAPAPPADDAPPPDPGLPAADAQAVGA